MVSGVLANRMTDVNRIVVRGEPIGAFRRVRRMIADGVIGIDGARPTLRRAAREIDRGREGQRAGANGVRRGEITPAASPGEVAG